MLYAILCYNSEEVVFSWTKEEDAQVMENLAGVQARWAASGKLGPSARLMPTTAATTLRKGDTPLVIDGPFAETKEQLLGFYLVDCEDLEEVLTFCKELGAVNPGGAYEIRPLHYFSNGSLPADHVAAPERVTA
ncbi:YciI family protein [Phenylobacterium sp.]|uniref:YciI family protein n=1 Tax=Phenylobacterium sp. TaxID=1871053 RepID=UPI00356252E5